MSKKQKKKKKRKRRKGGSKSRGHGPLGPPTGGRIKIRQIASPIGANPKQRQALDSLGLRRIRHVVERSDNASTRGLIRIVQHLIVIVEVRVDER